MAASRSSQTPAPYRHQPTGWNTWDFQGFNRLVYLKAGRTIVVVQFSIWDETVPAPKPPPDPEHRKIGRLYEQFRWEHVTRLGPHAPLGLPAVLNFKAGESEYTAEALDRNGTLELTVTPRAPSSQRIVFQFLAPVGETPERLKPTHGRFAGCEVRFKGCQWPIRYYVNVAEPYAIGEPGAAATIFVKPPGASASKGAGTVAVLQKSALTGGGALAEAPGAMMQAICWNTLYDTRRGLVSSPVSRDWCYDWRGVLVFCWDTFLVGTFMSYEAPELARLNFESVVAAIDELGHVPNYYMAHGAASRDRSMPPLGSYLIWKTQCASPDRAWLSRIYPRLARWHGYWFKHRDGNGSGLLSWGSNDVPYEFPQLVPYNNKLQHTRQSAMYESGLDNSPMFDGVDFDAKSCCLQLDDVALSSYFALDCDGLARIAEFLGHRAEAAHYRTEYARIAQRINEHLWDEQHGLYCNRHWDGRFSDRWSPTSFFPLLAGVATPDRAARMVREHLLNEREFWGPYVLPSISRSDPAYADNDYWRGRIWGPFNFLVAEGLRRFRFDAEAAELARRSCEMFMREWRKDGGVYENYNADTGEGADVWNAARLYHWGGLLAFIALQELVDVEPSGYLRFGSLEYPAAELRNVRLGGSTFDIALGDELRVTRSGKPYLHCSTRALVRLPLGGTPDEPIELTAAGPGKLTLFSHKGPRRLVRLSDGRRIEPTGRAPKLVWKW